jgi:predicted anti-sigma-YlaC factor YlaD
MNPRRSFARALLFGCALFPLAGCSVNKFAVNKLGDALASGGTTFASDDDPELVKQAVPFSLKLMESLLSESPNHRGLLLATSSGFTQYAFAFVQQDADELEATNFAAAQTMRLRAKRLYLRARDYGLRGLSVRHPGFTAALASDPRAAVARLGPADVAQAYWTAAALGAAIGVGKDDPALLAEIPQMEALIDRALTLDESWGNGAIHDFLITYELSRQGGSDDPILRARKHFERSLELSGGRTAGTFVTFAETVCVEQQDAAQFDSLLQRALAIKPDAVPEQRLATLVMQRRARWLLAQKEDLFLLPAKPAQS